MILSGLARAQAPAAPAAAGPACLKCHAPIERAMQRKFKHAAVDMGCDSCHVNHRAAGAASDKKAHYLSEEQPALCLTCHDAKDKQIVAAHRGQPFEKAACTGCHDPHASDGAKLTPARAHGPYEARQCGGCHQNPAADGKIVLTAGSASGLCFTCHDEFKKKFEGAPSKHTLLAADPNSCRDCHTPHASARGSFLKKSEAALCNDCHAELTAGKKYVHQPVGMSCTFCHDPHASNAKKNLYAAGNDLCLACHGPKAGEIVSAKAPVGLFDGRVKVAPGAFEDLRYLNLSPDGKLGHPFPKHPVRVDPGADKPEITCITCHLPHAANGGRQLLVTETSNSAKLCVRCHK
jgi:predicted CXXCH cytochrome family protein